MTVVLPHTPSVINLTFLTSLASRQDIDEDPAEDLNMSDIQA